MASSTSVPPAGSPQHRPAGGTIASLGEHDLEVAEGTEQHILVADVIKHSPYRSPLHSLTMVRLDRPARLSPYVQPIPMPTRCPQNNETCRVSGWRYSYLECMEVPVVDDQTCMDGFPEHLYWSRSMVCAGRADTDNCMRGTSSVMECGGQLQGLMWFQLGCEDPASPSVYTKMCVYTAWIQDVMGHYTPPPPLETPSPAPADVASDADAGLE
ncbi:hypothetical protein CRUP_001146 [Coryphaenoides rupestris]|nr:hypothetical protein CRUP_001146 [Coryphaenoides rupestris]